MSEPTTDSDGPADGQPAPTLSAQVVDPKWVARVDYISAEGKVGVWTRVSDAMDAAAAALDVLADLRAHRPGSSVSRVEAFAPSKANLVPRSVFAG